MYRHWQPVLRIYITPFMTARMSVRRLPPPGLAGGINGLTYAHSSSVRSLGYLRWSRLYLWRFSSVHIGGPSANQASSFESKRLTRFNKFRNGHLGAKGPASYRCKRQSSTNW